ncbi:hypothetical protein U8607_20895 [Methylobacterium durans]|uniref:hypothetical protein n=1 Tax=Methylobacterium durans TaxID=2202825 RepID=UPI002AFF07A4|nr:hypothetical protein [Methylobacterium durans]MEA1834555.1 hypothetical protein [Methylobacterium durans]
MRLATRILLAALLGTVAGRPAWAEPAPAPAAPQPPAGPQATAPQAPPVLPLMRVVPKGEARSIGFFAALFPDCSSQGPIVVRLLAQPKHGTVSFSEADSFPRYAAGSPLAACNAKRVPGLKMVYESEEGFEGLDTYRIFLINPDGTGFESEVKVSVR